MDLQLTTHADCAARVSSKAAIVKKCQGRLLYLNFVVSRTIINCTILAFAYSNLTFNIKGI